MNFWKELIHNEMLITASLAWLIAQIAKTIIHAFVTKDLNLERMYGSGGMPSCHSATVTALATSACFLHGPGSSEFALATILAIIVMYDARGVRRETGIQAKVINDINELLTKHSKITPPEKELKELIGHTPLQVLAGALLGFAIAFIVHSVF